MNRKYKKVNELPKNNNIPLRARILGEIFEFIYWIGALFLTVVIIVQGKNLFPSFYNVEPAYIYFMASLYVTAFCIIMIAIFSLMCILLRIKFNYVIMVVKNEGMTLGRLLFGPALFIVSVVIYIYHHFIL